MPKIMLKKSLPLKKSLLFGVGSSFRLILMLALAATALAIGPQAQAGFLIEPYVGFEGGELSPRVTDYKTPLVGARAGIRFARVLAVGLDVSHRFAAVKWISPEERIRDAAREAIDAAKRDAVDQNSASQGGASQGGASQGGASQGGASQGGASQGGASQNSATPPAGPKTQMTDLALFFMIDPGMWVRAYVVYAQMFRSKNFDTQGRSLRWGLGYTGLPFVAINFEMSRRKIDTSQQKASTTYGLTLSVPLP